MLRRAVRTRGPGSQWVILTAQFAASIGVGAPLAALPLHLTRELDVSGLVFGAVIGVFPVAAFFGRLVAGRTSDVRGRRAALLAGLVVAAVAATMFLFPGTILVLFLARLLQGGGHALVSIATIAWSMDVTPPPKRERSLSLLGAALWGGTSIGTLAGGLVGDLRFVGLLGLVTALLAIGLVSLTRGPAVIPRGETRRSVLPRAAVLPGGTFALASVGYAAMVGFVVVHLDASDVNGTIALVTFTVTVLVGRFVAVPLALSIGLARALPGALILSAAGLVLVGLATELALALTGSVLVAIGYCVLWPVLGALVAGRVRADQRGAALGALAASYDVAVGASSIPFGLLVAGATTEWIFLAAAVSSLVAGAAGIVLGRGVRGDTTAESEQIVPAGEPS